MVVAYIDLKNTLPIIMATLLRIVLRDIRRIWRIVLIAL